MDLAAWLDKRRPEIEQATLARVYAVSDPAQVGDPEYTAGLREAVGAALDYGIVELEASGSEPAPIPDRLLAQARAAARNRVSLDTVLRRYSAGYALLGDFAIEEAERADSIPGAELKRALRALSGIFDRLVASISQEYAEEADRRLDTFRGKTDCLRRGEGDAGGAVGMITIARRCTKPAATYCAHRDAIGGGDDLPSEVVDPRAGVEDRAGEEDASDGRAPRDRRCVA